MQGINRAYPELATPILSEAGKAAFELMKDGCVGLTGDGSPRPTGHFADFTTVADPFESEGARAVAPLITLPFAGEAPIADTFVFHATGDALIPVEGADAMVRAWCDAGSPVAYHRVPGSGHVALAPPGQVAAWAYLSSRLEGGAVDVLPEGTTSCNR
jgi:acetyl esterase/lipase